MMPDAWLPAFILATSLLAAPVIFLLPEQSGRARTVVNLSAALIKLLLVVVLVWGLHSGHRYEQRFTALPGIDIILRADLLGAMFAGLSSLLWLFTTIYAIGYLEGSPNRRRFFGFFSLCVASTLGIALAGNLFTFLVFYELLTVSTYPLVVHRGSPRALAAGAAYLRYTVSGGVIFLLGIICLHALAGPVEFGEPARLALLNADRAWLIAVFITLMIGLGVKAALVPLHGWLPRAMIAPAPVSALLHAVAVVKAGAFGIVRVVYDVYGVAFSHELGVLNGLMAAACVTIIYGSLRALKQQDIKGRLAYSTVSQVSYIMLGVSLFGPMGTTAGVAHLIHQGLMKVTLFFCAGNYAETLGVHRIDALDGAGRRMPWTSLAFSVAALGMIGIPPVAGFFSKWFLGMGAVESGNLWVLLVLVASSALNAAYFLPVIYRLWFKAQAQDWREERKPGRLETSGWLLWPALATAFCSLAVGVLARVPFSPLSQAADVAAKAYMP